jgi:hypothetical protein
MNYYFYEIVQENFTLPKVTSSDIEMSNIFNLYLMVVVFIWILSNMFVKNDDDEDGNEVNEDGNDVNEDGNEEDIDNEVNEDENEVPENDMYKFERPAILHIHSIEERTQGESDNLAYALMSVYGMYADQVGDRANSIYYNYYGDFYIIYTKEFQNNSATTLVGEGLSDELSNRYNVSLNRHCDHLMEFSDTMEMVTYLNEAIAVTMEKTIETLYEDEIDYEIPKNIFKCVNLLYSNNIKWDSLPDGNVYGKWIKISLSNNTGGYNMVDFTGIAFRENSTSVQTFIDFIGDTELPTWHYCNLVKKLKSDIGSIPVDLVGEDDDDEDDSSHSSMPELIAIDDDSSHTHSSMPELEQEDSSDQEEESTETSDEPPPLVSCTPEKRISKRRSSFDSDYNIRGNFLRMKELIEHLRNKTIVVVEEDLSSTESK